jgi:glycosyltransferase involved in cell wall biosynthesis
MMGRYPLECMPSFFSQADVLFLSLKDDYIFSLTTPAKLQAYMASGKPVLAMIDGDARQTIIDSNCGMSCASGDYKAFAECVLKLKDMPRIELDTLGINGRLCFEKHFRMEKCIDDLCTLIIKNNDTE